MLNEKGRAGFVMANSASDAGYSELEIRKKLIEKGVVDVIISVSSNFFYTVTLPVTLWFLNKGKKSTNDKDKVLFIDARKIYNQIDRAHRDFTPQQIEFIANIVRLYRGQEIETEKCSKEIVEEKFPNFKYRDLEGLCKVVTVDKIRSQSWSLNPGRYVGIVRDQLTDFKFAERFKELHEQLRSLTNEAYELEDLLTRDAQKLLEGFG